MFSTTTMPLSTNIPNARIRLNSTTMFIVKPIICMMLNDISIESGIAIPTNDAVCTPSTKSSTPTTRMRPEMMLFSRLLTMSRISSDWSDVIFTTVPGGNSGRIAPIADRTASAVAIMFSPLRFDTPNVTTGFPSRRA